MTIRAATAEDAEAVERVRVRAWHRAYGDFLAPEDMIDARYDEDERVARRREQIADPVIRTWVFELEGVVGFASAAGSVLRALYVEPAAQGAGVGSRLLRHAEAAMREQGARVATLRVFAANEHGRRFYEARGWELVEGSEEQGDLVAPHVRYRKPL